MDFRQTARNLAFGLRSALNPSARVILHQFFDRGFYLQTYPDVASSNWPPLLHYLLQGYREMRDPGPAFSTGWYLRKNPDVLRANVCPLLHYAIFGNSEGRPARPSSRFAPRQYPRNAPAASELELWPVDKPLVSVVVPCFNYGSVLARCLDSLAHQTFRDFEVLVIEGGSTDPESVVRVKELEKQSAANTRFLYRSSPCMVADNRNYGIAAAKGKYVCCLDADDMLHAAFLEVAVFLAEAEDFDIVSPSVQSFGDSQSVWLLQSPCIETLAQRNCISPAALFRKEVWQNIGGYRDFGRGAEHVPEDWDFWIRALGRGFRATALAAPLHLYSVHEGGLSREGNHASFPRRLVEANRDLIASPQPVRPGRSYTNPLVNLRRTPYPNAPRGVLFCLPWITIGGAENNLRAIAMALMQAGVQVAVITTADLLPGMPDDTSRFESSGAVVYNLPDLLSNTPLWPLFIEELLYRHNVETIFQCGSEYIYELLPLLRERHRSLRIVDQLFLDEGHVATNRRFAKFIDLTLVPSASLRDILTRTYQASPAEFRLIPHALLPSFDDPTGLDPALLEKMRDKFVVSFIGRFSPEKEPALFVKLVLRLASSPDYFFLLVGDGPLRQQVLDSASELSGRFFAPGAVTNARAYIAASDVVVLPSKLEGLPGVLLESLAAGRAVVASSVGAIPEVIADGVNGFLCDYADLNRFFECIERLHRDTTLLASIQASATESARGNFGFDSMMHAYREILAPRSAGA